MQIDSYDCVHCVNSVEETLEHLFLDCPFALASWDMINVEIQIQSSFPDIVV